jgi:NADH-quinone oxidoreductase subunit L
MFDPFDTTTLIWAIPCLSLIAFAATVVLSTLGFRSKSHLPIITTTAIAFLVSLVVLYTLLQVASSSVARPETFSRLYTWFETEGLVVRFGFSVDMLSAVMLLTITFVGFFIAVFSAGYMHGDPAYPRFFVVMSLFLFAMTGLVLADNLLLLFGFWEGVGLCSYLLIGFWFERPSAAAAARKAFLVTRMGDAALLLGILLLWHETGSLQLSEVFRRINEGSPNLPLICLLLTCGAVGKSAQFPLHVWLPDAMEGPTPASALIHAATMVTAGVYLVARCSKLFVMSPSSQLVVAIIGATTALLGALIALTQSDLKRVLAYSTVSQLGYMFLGLGAGLKDSDLIVVAVVASIFHLVTHAFFKALLFLAAGSVMHSMGGVVDMSRFSGLRKIMPLTHWTYLAGSLALAGLIPFSGFWSKDKILEVVKESTHESAEYSTVYFVLFGSSLLTAGLTAYYSFRAYFMTFHGTVKIPVEAGEHAHESPRIMTIPLIVLAGGALFLGLIFEGLTGIISNFLIRSTAVLGTAPETHTDWSLLIQSTFVAVIGIGCAYYLNVANPQLRDSLSRIVRPLQHLSRQRFYFDEVYSVTIISAAKALSVISIAVDYVIDGIVDFTAVIPRICARVIQPIQNGLIQFYALVMVVFVTAFVCVFVLWMFR